MVEASDDQRRLASSVERGQPMRGLSGCLCMRVRMHVRGVGGGMVPDVHKESSLISIMALKTSWPSACFQKPQPNQIHDLKANGHMMMVVVCSPGPEANRPLHAHRVR